MGNRVFLSDTNQRKENQDSHLIVEFTPFGASSPLLILTVSDGIGGFEHGAEVSREVLRQTGLSVFQQLAIEPALNAVSASRVFGLTHIAHAVTEAAMVVNASVARMIEANRWERAGATIVIASVFKNEAVVFNVGDSPLFHYVESAQTLSQVTEDHTVAATLLKAGLITPEIARYHEGNSQLEFYLGGDTMPPRTPIRYLKLQDGDLLLLCTDGISRLVGLEQMNRIICRMRDCLELSNGLANLAEALREEALFAGEVDNQTLIIWRYANNA